MHACYVRTYMTCRYTRTSCVYVHVHVQKEVLLHASTRRSWFHVRIRDGTLQVQFARLGEARPPKAAPSAASSVHAVAYASRSQVMGAMLFPSCWSESGSTRSRLGLEMRRPVLILTLDEYSACTTWTKQPSKTERAHLRIGTPGRTRPTTCRWQAKLGTHSPKTVLLNTGNVL